MVVSFDQELVRRAACSQVTGVTETCYVQGSGLFRAKSEELERTTSLEEDETEN